MCGINVINKNGLRKIVGDVDYEDVIKKVSFISPVPRGVGPMTIHLSTIKCLLCKKIKIYKIKLSILSESFLLKFSFFL